LSFNVEDGVEDGDNNKDKEHDDIYSDRSHAQQHRGLQLDDDVDIEEDEDEDEDEDGDEDKDKDAEPELVDNCEVESCVEDVINLAATCSMAFGTANCIY
jgi:hypothetical protein